MSERPTATASFFKGHGLGNDYLIFFSGDGWRVTAEAARAVCDPHLGVGADGIVVVTATDPTVTLRMFNPDGGEFERSGNGLRIAAAALYRRGLVASDPFQVHTGGGPALLRIHGERPQGTFDASAALGRAEVGPAAVGLDSTADDVAEFLEHPTRGAMDVVPVSVGNPHLVVFTDDLSDTALNEIGPFLATHSALGAGANVQLARVDERGIRIRIWERGVGRTAASGTSATAVAVAAVVTGRRRPGLHAVRMDGGEFRIDVTEDLRATLRGPVAEVFAGELGEGFLEGLSG